MTVTDSFFYFAWEDNGLHVKARRGVIGENLTQSWGLGLCQCCASEVK